MRLLAGFAPSISISLAKSSLSGGQLGINRTFSQFHVRQRSPKSVVIETHVTEMRYSGGGNSRGIPPVERLLGIAPYLLPLLDGLAFGRYVFAAAPAIAAPILQVLGPIYALYRGIPFVAFGVFLALYILVVRNTNVSRFVRFNTFQALMIDIALIVPQLLASFNVGASIPSNVVELLSSTVFYAVLLAVGYAVAQNVRGQLPDKIPAVSDSVYAQLGMY